MPEAAVVDRSSLRRRLLFGTTSYVLPADLLPNIRLLAPFVDDIELILFEGEESNLPTRADVGEMGRLARDGGCGFTVHLPLDVGIGELDAGVRRRAQETCLRVIDLTLPLEPHAFVVHPELPLVYHPALGDDPDPLDELPVDVHIAWQESLGESLGRFAAETGPFPLAVENLQFPYGWVRPLLEEHDLGVTMDVGHLLMHGGAVAAHLAEFGGRLTVVHLHGIVDGRDHREIGAFSMEELGAIIAAVAASGTRRPAIVATHSTRPAWMSAAAPAPAAVADSTGPVWASAAPAPGAHGSGAARGSETRGSEPDANATALPVIRGGPDAATPSGPPVVVSLEVFGWRSTVPSLRTLATLLAAPRAEATLGVRNAAPLAARLAAAADAVMAALPTFEAAP